MSNYTNMHLHNHHLHEVSHCIAARVSFGHVSHEALNTLTIDCSQQSH
jgi:hypothetical protein